MANSDKNIVITPNIGQTDDPKIVFSGADASTAAQNITLYTYPTDNGTLSFEGTSGQLFSITNSLSGTIFSVNDVSGIPSIEVDDDGTIRLAEFAGSVLIGTAIDNGTDLLQVDGSVSATGFTGDLTGNADTASALETARTISLGGVLSGSASFDGSSNITITAAHTSDPTLTINGDASGSATFTNLGSATLTLTIADDSHNHTIANVDGLQTALNGKLSTSGKAADSNLLDGLDLHTARNNEANKVVRTDNSGYIQAGWINTTSGATTSTINKIYASADDYIRYVTPATLISQLGLWTSGNDGSGSGLDADLLDGQQGSVYMRKSADSQLDMNNNDIVGVDQIIHEGDTDTYIQFHASDQWRVVTGGAERFEVNNSLITSTEPINAPDFNSTSDRALKEDIVQITDALEKVQQLNGYTFTYKSSKTRAAGVIAQEVEQVLPEVVHGEEGSKSVSYGNMVSLLVEAVKEQQQQIEGLKEQLVTLREKIK